MAALLRRLVSEQLAYKLIRWRNVLLGMLFFFVARRLPAFTRHGVLQRVRAELGPGYDVRKHFTPRYGVWDQRLCLVPDGDLFAAIRAGRVSVVTDQIDTFTERGIALRSGAELQAENVVTRKLADIPLGLFAAPSYLQAHGAPADPDTSLAGHELVLFAASRLFSFENEWFEPRLAGARIALRSDSVSSIYAATVAGVGIALLPRAAADRDPELRRIPTASAPEPRVIWQTVHADLQKNARVRAVLDFLSEILTAAAG
jgi:DNA-binding transcriptional LysR family regulator